MNPFVFDAETIVAGIRRTEIFSILDEKEARSLAGKASVKMFGPGEVVVREKDPGDSLFLVRRGSLRVTVGGAGVGDLREGDVFGEMSLLTGEPRRATVEAAGEVCLIEIGKADLEPVLRSDPALIGRLSDILAGREEINLERTRAAAGVPSHESLVEGFVRKLKSFFGVS